MTATVVHASAVVITGRALLIEGPPGSGKSSLALALVDDGAELIGDDAVTLTPCTPASGGAQVLAGPPPNIAGMLEVRGVGIIRLPVAPPAPVALILSLGGDRLERLPSSPLPVRVIAGVAVPVLAFDPGTIAPAARARRALDLHGTPLQDASLSGRSGQDSAP